MDSILLQIIEILRQKMVEKAIERGNFLDEQVVKLSQQLDIFIYQQQLLLVNKEVYSSSSKEKTSTNEKISAVS